MRNYLIVTTKTDKRCFGFAIVGDGGLNYIES